MTKSQIGGRPQIIMNKDMLMHLMSIGSNNTDVTKIINAGRNLVAHCVKFHGLTDF